MFDTSRALADMAGQIRAHRAADGLTLQQLATRSGVAASTIHKVEARQMVPTVSVLLKIAKGLGCRPEQLIRDHPGNEGEAQGETDSRDLAESASSPRIERDSATNGRAHSDPDSGTGSTTDGARAGHDVGVWRIDLSNERGLPPLDLEPKQRAIVLVERGAVELQAGDRRVQMDTGDCIEVVGGRLESALDRPCAASLTLIVSPPGNLAVRLGSPRPSAPVFS